MKRSAIGQNTVRDQLKAKRNRLFEEYSKNPMNIRFSTRNHADTPAKTKKVLNHQEKRTWVE